MREFRRKESHWKHYTLLIILLSHTVLGSPALNAVGASNGSSTITNSNVSTSSPSEKSQDTVLLEESAFGSGSISDPDANSTVSDATNNQGSREKRTLYETWKKAKKIKLISLGEASASAVKQVGKSIFKNIATLGIKAIIFNFLYSKINQVLDFKTRMLNNLEQKNREQNAQLLGIGVESTSSEKSAPAAAGSNADGASSDGFK